MALGEHAVVVSAFFGKHARALAAKNHSIVARFCKVLPTL
jgi:hypothetical protein